MKCDRAEQRDTKREDEKQRADRQGVKSMLTARCVLECGRGRRLRCEVLLGAVAVVETSGAVWEGRNSL